MRVMASQRGYVFEVGVVEGVVAVEDEVGEEEEEVELVEVVEAYR